jgi:hypothetical protein
VTDPFFKPELIVLPDDIGVRAAQVGGLTPMPADTPAPISANGAQPADSAVGGWQRIDLTDSRYAIPPDPPTTLGLIYTGLRHVISGPPESTKTLVSYMILIETLRSKPNNTVAIIDFEMGPVACRRLLDDLNATHNELARIWYVEPDRQPDDQQLEQIIQHQPALVLLDASAGAYDVTGLDDNARKDAEKFARHWIRPFWKTGIATLVIDHVTKSADTRGKFTIGSERKVGQADVHLSLDALKPLSRGHTGIVKVTVHKDRPGFLQRPTAVVFDLASDPDTHTIGWAARDPHPVDEETGMFRPTVLMEKVSRHLEQLTQPCSRNQIEEHVKGKREYVRDAIDILVLEDYIHESRGPRGARLFSSTKPYRTPVENSPEPVDHSTSNDFAPTSPRLRPGEDMTTSPHLAPPLTGGARSGARSVGDVKPPTSPHSEHVPTSEEEQAEIERLLELYGDDPERGPR